MRKLQMSLLTSLRGYADLMLMHRRSLQLRQWADRFPDLLGVRDWNSLLWLVMLRLRELFPETPLSAFVCRNDGPLWPLTGGTGRYPAEGCADVLPLLNEAQAAVLLQAWNTKTLAEAPDAQALYFEVTSGESYLLFLDLPQTWDPFERNVARLVVQNFRAVLENRALISELEQHRLELNQNLAQKEEILGHLHHRFQNSLQVILSLIEIERRDQAGVTGRTPLVKAERRLQTLGLVYELLHASRHTAALDFQPFLQSLLDQDQRSSQRSSSAERLEYWGVPLTLELSLAVPLAFAVLEMIDLVHAPTYRRIPKIRASIRLSDAPRSVEVAARGCDLPDHTNSPSAALEWQILHQLAQQLGGKLTVSPQSLVLEF